MAAAVRKLRFVVGLSLDMPIRSKPALAAIAIFIGALGLLFVPACFGKYPHASMLEPTGACFPEPKSYIAFELWQHFDGGSDDVNQRCQPFRISVGADGAAMYTNRHEHKLACPHIAAERVNRINALIANIEDTNLETVSHGCKLHLLAPRGFSLERVHFPSELKAEVGAILKDVDPSLTIGGW